MKRKSTNCASRKGTSLFLVLLCILLLAAILFAGFWFFTADSRLYRKGERLMAKGEYHQAISVFEQLPDNDLAAQQILEATYQIGCRYLEDKQYPDAAAVFTDLASYRDSPQQLQICHYQLGNAARLKKDYETAKSHYSLAGEYSDARTQAQRMIYAMGHAAFLAGEYSAANAMFDQLEGSQSDYGNPHFETLADAVDYLDQQRLALSDRINFHIDAEADEDFYDTLRNVFPCQYYYANYYEPDKLLTIAGIHYYPAENILWAIRNNDTSALTEEERQVLDLARQTVAQAQAESTSLYETEQWLHDWLCNQVRYESPNMDIRRQEYIQLRELTCVGAMLDGIANCQGYADAFYLLGNMAGLEVGRVLGVTGEGHIWNTVVLDGQRYIVDVTFDDLSDQELNGWSYTYFNTFWDPSVYDPYGDDHAAQTVVTEPDLSQSYYSHNQQIFSSVEDAADSLIRQYVEEGCQWTYAMVSQTDITHDTLDKALRNRLWKYAKQNRTYAWTQWLDSYGGNGYIVICWQ